MPRTSYAIAIGSNRRHGRHGGPGGVVAAAAAALASRLAPSGGRVLRVSPVIGTPALGPAGRAFANAAALIETELDPPALLALVKGIERDFGRRRVRRWGPRVIDLDLILWSGGCWQDDRLTIPHRQFRYRDFVLQPLARIAPEWRDPATGLSVRQLRARLMRATPVDRRAADA